MIFLSFIAIYSNIERGRPSFGYREETYHHKFLYFSFVLSNESDNTANFVTERFKTIILNNDFIPLISHNPKSYCLAGRDEIELKFSPKNASDINKIKEADSFSIVYLFKYTDIHKLENLESVMVDMSNAEKVTKFEIGTI